MQPRVFVQMSLSSSLFCLCSFLSLSNCPVSSCQVDETTEREEGWLFGSKQGKMGWFPESYVERVAQSNTANNTAATAPKVPLQSQLSSVLEAAKTAGTKSAFTPTHSTNPAPTDTQGQVRGLQRVMPYTAGPLATTL